MADKNDETREIIEKLGVAHASMATQLSKAARYLLDHPNEIGVHSMRQLAGAADVHPNVLVRLARAIGFSSYEAFRRPFQDQLLNTSTEYPDRARWLQNLAHKHRHSALYRDIAASSLKNLEEVFSSSDAAKLSHAAIKILKSNTTYVVGVGVCHSLAHYFTYASQLAIKHLVHVPKPGNLPIDDLVNATKDDVVVSMTFSPFRADVIAATKAAKKRGAYLIGITDRLTSPILAIADQSFVVPDASPHFFPSMVAAFALLETLNAFMIAEAGADVIKRIDELHSERTALGVYVPKSRPLNLRVACDAHILLKRTQQPGVPKRRPRPLLYVHWARPRSIS